MVILKKISDSTKEFALFFARRFLRLNIAKKMLLGYIPLSVLLIFIAIFSLSNLERILQLNKQILFKDIMIIQSTENMLDNILELELFASRYTILKSPEMLQLYHERILDFQEMVAQLETTSSLYTTEKSKIPFSKLRELNKEYDTLLRKGFRSSDSQKEPPGYLASNVKAKQDELFSILNQISSQAREDQNRKILVATNLGDSTFKLIIFICIAGAIISIVTALLITHNISVSVHKLKLATKQVAEGNFENLPSIKNQDELGDLSVSFTHMATRLKTLEEMYVDSSPLTHLPGGVAIENVLKKRIASRGPLSFCMLDLDNFKALNDYYGYARGNDVIKYAAKIIESTVAVYGDSTDFIGHIGGDDFVVLTTPKNHADICRNIIKKFDRKAPKFYDEEDLKRGYIVEKTRQGVEARFPFVSISIAVVTNHTHELKNHIQAGELIAELKEYAKSIEGSVYVVDKRRMKSRVKTQTKKEVDNNYAAKDNKPTTIKEKGNGDS